MPQVTITMSEAELTEAVRHWIERKGYDTSDRFAVSVRSTPGDRPFDPSYTEATVTGALMRDPEPDDKPS